MDDRVTKLSRIRLTVPNPLTGARFSFGRLGLLGGITSLLGLLLTIPAVPTAPVLVLGTGALMLVAGPALLDYRKPLTLERKQGQVWGTPGGGALDVDVDGEVVVTPWEQTVRRRRGPDKVRRFFRVEYLAPSRPKVCVLDRGKDPVVVRAFAEALARLCHARMRWVARGGRDVEVRAVDELDRPLADLVESDRSRAAPRRRPPRTGFKNVQLAAGQRVWWPLKLHDIARATLVALGLSGVSLTIKALSAGLGAALAALPGTCAAAGLGIVLYTGGRLVFHRDIVISRAGITTRYRLRPFVTLLSMRLPSASIESLYVETDR